MEFEVASLKDDTAAPSQETKHANIPLGPTDAFNATGGLFSASNYTLFIYMAFAYKLTTHELDDLVTSLPKWANTMRFDIQARASGNLNPTKDQFRLMMQALLADRFKLAIHFETRQLPVLALVLNKPGKLGPKLRKHPADQPCSVAFQGTGTTGTVKPPTTDEGFPVICSFASWLEGGRIHAGGRNMDFQSLANLMTDTGTNIDRPVLDRTGLAGKYDFIFEFTPTLNGPQDPGLQLDESGPTLEEALKEQLGLKLVPQTGPVEVIVVDHVEQPTSN